MLPFICLWVPIATAAGPAEISLDRASPDWDRWNYGFNASPGTRSVGSTFSAFESGYPFDDRDGQVLVAYITGDEVDAGWPASAYRVVSCVLEVSIASDDLFYDPTVDSYVTHGQNGQADEDPGRAMILSGVGYRNGFDVWSFGEEGPFGDPMASGVRNCYPIDFTDQGVARDISNSITEGFDPSPWSVGEIQSLSSGDAIPAYSVVRFELNVEDTDVQCGLRTGLADGVLPLMISSLHPASEPGSGGPAAYPDWVLRENPLIDLGITSAARLQLQVELVPPSDVSGDVTGDGLVSIDDLLVLLGSFGRCPCCPADVDQSGGVDVNDVLLVIGAWDQ